MNTPAPNPYSPYATADPGLRHLFPTLFGPPAPGALQPTGCYALAVVGDQPIELDPTADQLPDGLCTECVAHMRGHDAPETRPFTNCRGCGADTRHNSLCALCRAEAHELWQTIRTVAEPPPAHHQERGPFIAMGGPLSVTPGAFCEHGDLAFAARLTGYHLPHGQEQHLDVVLPRCYLAKLLGAVLAIVDHDSTPEAQDRFTTTVNRTQNRVRANLEHRAAERDQNKPDHP